jgi:hypothetical protein
MPPHLLEKKYVCPKDISKFFKKNGMGVKKMSPDGGNPTREKRVATSGDIFFKLHIRSVASGMNGV